MTVFLNFTDWRPLYFVCISVLLDFGGCFFDGICFDGRGKRRASFVKMSVTLDIFSDSPCVLLGRVFNPRAFFSISMIDLGRQLDGILVLAFFLKVVRNTARRMARDRGHNQILQLLMAFEVGFSR
jgi:hypothetical protein